MSWTACPQAEAQPDAVATASAIELAIVPRSRDIGGFMVSRALPARERPMIGPFIFFDQMGPSHFKAGQGMDVRAHPHIGLATLTYLFTGEVQHRDSLGNVQCIRPGEVNWMTAGRGIAHSERTPAALREQGSPLSGIQAWVALPAAAEEAEPSFSNHSAAALPEISEDGFRARLIAGRLFGMESPVQTFSPMVYADVQLGPGGHFPVDAELEQRALYLVEGEVSIAGQRHAAGQMLVLAPGEALSVSAAAPARLMLIGGAAMDGPRHIWWNFVSSRRERIEQAKADWQAGRFAAVAEEAEFIPLPDLPGP